MPEPTAIANLTSAPLRNRIRVALDAAAPDVWSLIGDLPRFPEYSAGLDRVDATRGPDGRWAEFVCHFKASVPGEPGVVHRERMRWFEAGRGYASSAEPQNTFGLQDALNQVVIEAIPGGTLLTWDEYFDALDVATNVAAYDQALRDIADRLIARFGGRVIERYAGGRAAGEGGPVAVVAGFSEAVNRGDLEAALAHYEDDAVLLVQPEQVARGREQVGAALRGFMALRPTLATTEHHVLEADDVALYLGVWTLTGVGPDGAVVSMGGVSSDVLRRQTDGRWLIALDNPWGATVLE